MAADTSPYQLPRDLVGRLSELDQLGRCLNRVRSGTGASVVISGEAGIGKTALVSQLRDVARSVTGHCYEFSATPPYGPWIEVLDDVRLQRPLPAPNQAAASGDSWSAVHDRHEVLARVLDELSSAAGDKPLVVILEDMHWADEASVELLRAFCAQITRYGILIAVTYRDDDLLRDSPLYRMLPHLLRDGGSERIHLQRLSRHDTDEIIARRYDLNPDDSLRLGAYLQSRAQGNPFFVTEMLYALEEQKTLRLVNGKWQYEQDVSEESHHLLPDLIRQVIEARLARLSELTRHLLQVAAVIGPDVPLRLWRDLCDVDEHAFSAGIEKAIDAHFIQEAPGGRALSFRHALVREVIYLSVVLPERQHLHRLAGEAILREADPSAENVAYHLARAMDKRAADWLAISAEQALALSAPHAAIRRCDFALDIVGSLALEPPAAVFRTRGNAYATLGEFVPALKDLTVFLERSRTGNDPRSEWQALQDLGQLWSARDYSRTREYFDEALVAARALKDESLIAHSLSRVGNWYLNADRPAEAVQFHEEALEIFRHKGDLPAVAQTTDLMGMDLLILGNHVSAERVFSEAIDMFTALDDRVGLCSALGSYITVSGSTGFEQETPARVPAQKIEQMMEQALALARDTSWRSGDAFIHCAIGNHHLARGHYGKALHAFEQATSIARAIEHREWLAYALTGVADVHLGLLSPARSREYAEQALESALLGGSRIHENGARASLSAALLARGDTGAALDVLQPCCATHGRPTSAIQRLCRVFQAQATLKSGDALAALEMVDELLESALPPDFGNRAPVLGRVRAEALIALDRVAEAESDLLAARDFARELGYIPELLRILMTLGSLYLTLRKPGHARRAFKDASETIDSLAGSVPDPDESTRFVSAARASLPDNKGLTPFQSTRQESGGLTPRQREVAVLVARGWTNAAISTELSISERTVEGHVSAIMATLNFTSRSQIAAWAVDQKLVSL